MFWTSTTTIINTIIISTPPQSTSIAQHTVDPVSTVCVRGTVVQCQLGSIACWFPGRPRPSYNAMSMHCLFDTALRARPRSHGVPDKLEQLVATTPEPLNLISDDEGEAEAMTVDCQLAVTGALPDVRVGKASPAAMKRKTQRRVKKEDVLQTRAVVRQADFAPILCILLPAARGLVAVPLWGQYTAVWKNQDFQNELWVKLTNQENWVKEIVKVLTDKPNTQARQREIARKVCSKLRVEFNAVIKPTRSHDDEDDDSDDEDAEPKPKKHRALEAVAIPVHVGSFPLTCVNTSKLMLLAADEKTAVFIMGYVVPMVKQIVNQCKDVGADSDEISEKSAAPKPTAAAFQMPQSPMPNIRGKVNWNVLKHHWQLTPHKSETTPPGPFRVNSHAPKDVYDKQKWELYCTAIDTWNSRDIKGRQKIPEPFLFGPRPGAC